MRESSPGLSGGGAGKELSPNFPRPPLARSRELDRRLGGAKLNGSDRECKYFAVGINARRRSCVTYSSQFSNFQLLLLFLYQLHIYRLTSLSLTPRGSANALWRYWHELLDLVYFYKATHNMIRLLFPSCANAREGPVYP